jgi:hypothetical protein
MLFIAVRAVQSFFFWQKAKALQASGVPFPNGWNLFTDMMGIAGILDEFKSEMALALAMKRSFAKNGEKPEDVNLPPVLGLCLMFGEPFVFIKSHKYLQDLYINKNASITKDKNSTRMFSGVMDKGIFFAHTHDKSYIDKRKELSGAFFKAKLIGMT